MAIVAEEDGNLTVTIGQAQQILLPGQGNGNAFLTADTPGQRPVTSGVDKDNKVTGMTLTIGRSAQLFTRA